MGNSAIQFASESYIDEIAATTGADPVAFRLRYLKAPRDIAVVKAAAERGRRLTRPSKKYRCNLPSSTYENVRK